MPNQDTPSKLGRYSIVKELGKGAMGVVYEGIDPNIGRRVAIKTARRDVMAASTMADEMMERFLREARAAGALNHPNIITIYDAGEEGGIAYIAMEYLEGGDLRDLLHERLRLDTETVAGIGAQICDALTAAHEKGIIHRDIKPANIMMPESGTLKLADFGIAHVNDSTLTQDGALIGTPHYMSPEQFMGQKLDGRSDLFSVGVILYEMLTGEKPFTGEALSTVMHHVIKTQPVPPCELNFNISPALSMVVMKALNKRPAERYADGKSMAAALRESIKPQPDPAILGFDIKAATDQTTSTVPDTATVMMQNSPAGSTILNPALEAFSKTAPDQIQAPVSPPSPRQTTFPSPKSSRLRWGAAAAGVLVIAGLLFVFFGPGNTTNNAQEAVMNPGASTTESQSATPYFGSITFDVWQAKNMEVFNAHENNPEERLSRDDIVAVDTPIHVKIIDGNEKVVAQSDTYQPGTTLSFSGQPQDISWFLEWNGVKSEGGLPPLKKPLKPNESLRREIIFKPKS